MEHEQGDPARRLLDVIAAADPPPPPLPARHTLTLIPAPQTGIPTLLAAVCACGYVCDPTSRNGAATSGLQHVAAAVIDDAAGILTAGLAWLIGTEQPAEALTTHHGVGRGTGDRRFRFVPSPTWPIIVMELTHPARDQRGNLLNPLTKHDVKALHVDLIRRGQTIRSTWNGVGCDTVSVALGGTVHPTLLDAVETYHRGCPVHHTVFCSPDRNGCDWYATGNRHLVKPAWPDLEVSGR